MTISLFRPGRQAAAGAAAILATLALTAVPSPAYAEDGQPVLALSNANDANIDNAGTSIGLYLYNYGDAPATDVTVTYDGSSLTDDVVVTVEDFVEGCRQTGKTVACDHGDLQPGQTELVYLITLASRPGSTPGEAGKVDVTLTGKGPDDSVSTATWGLPVTIMPAGPNLVASAENIGSEQDRVGAGDTRPLNAALVNKGDTAMEGFYVTIGLPTGATFAERYSDCVYSIDWPGEPPAGYVYGPSTVTCRTTLALLPDEGLALFDPETGEAVFNATFGKNLPGPERDLGFFEVGPLDEQQLPDTRARARSAGGAPSFADKVAELRAQAKDTPTAQPGDPGTASKPGTASAPETARDSETASNLAEFEIWTKANSHDFGVSATTVTGDVGDTVEVPYTITNHGPSDGSAGWRIVAPSGTVLLPSERCYFHDGQGNPVAELPEVTCNTESEWPAKASGAGVVTATIRVKINSTPGTDGTITVNPSGPSEELEPENNTAKIVINESTGGGGGELPITGVQVGLIAAIGGGSLAIGTLLFLVARRRRDVVPSPSE